MRTWEFTVALDPESELPLFLQLARAVAEDIRSERLRPGDALPGSRTLARTLGVHRNTVLAGYAELAAEGWVISRTGGGTFVAERLPGDPPRPRPHRRLAGAPGYELAAPLVHLPPSLDLPRGTLLLAKGTPDVRLLPQAALARAYRRVLQRHGRALLYYGDPRGHPRLRAALADMMSSTRDVPAPADAVVVTHGSQMALDLVARALVRPGDVVAVEALGHVPSWTAFRQPGAELVPIAVDGDGLDVDALAALVARRPIRAVCVTPHHQFPTTTVMPETRRRQLLELAVRHRFAIVEDDYDHEFHYAGRPVLPLASRDPHGSVIYLGTLSKILAPGLRLGFIVAPPPVVERIVSLRVAIDLHGDQTVECAVAELFEDGELQRHVRRMRSLYRARRDVLVSALAAELSGVIEARPPAGGMALWARVLPPHDVEAWSERALAVGVAFLGGGIYDFARRRLPFTRLGFTFLDEAELREAVRRMALALPGRVGAEAARSPAE